jgi:hypothetical protein
VKALIEASQNALDTLCCAWPDEDEDSLTDIENSLRDALAPFEDNKKADVPLPGCPTKSF